jgi:hypothetical protein
MKTHTCIRTIAFTCFCDADGNSSDEELMGALTQRMADVAAHGEWQEACGQDASDIQPVGA